MEIDIYDVGTVADIALFVTSLVWAIIGGIRSIVAKGYSTDMKVEDINKLDAKNTNRRESAKIAIRYTWLFITVWIILTMFLIIRSTIEIVKKCTG